MHFRKLILTELTNRIVKQIHFSITRNNFDFIYRPFSPYPSYAKFFSNLSNASSNSSA